MARTLNYSLLRQARRNRRLTLRRLADELGIDKSTAWRLENGKLRMTVDMLFRWLEVCEASVESVTSEERGN